MTETSDINERFLLVSTGQRFLAEDKARQPEAASPEKEEYQSIKPNPPKEVHV